VKIVISGDVQSYGGVESRPMLSVSHLCDRTSPRFVSSISSLIFRFHSIFYFSDFLNSYGQFPEKTANHRQTYPILNNIGVYYECKMIVKRKFGS